MLKPLAIAGVAFALAACTQPQPYQQAGYYNNPGYHSGYQNLRPHMVRNAAIGAAVGAAAGQAIGQDTEATVTGAIVGGLLGSQINQQ